MSDTDDPFKQFGDIHIRKVHVRESTTLETLLHLSKTLAAFPVDMEKGGYFI